MGESIFFLFLVALLIGSVGFVACYPLKWVASHGVRNLAIVWFFEAAVLAGLILYFGTDAWINQAVLNEPGEWMTIQAAQSVLACTLAMITGYAIYKYRIMQKQ